MRVVLDEVENQRKASRRMSDYCHRMVASVVDTTRGKAESLEEQQKNSRSYMGELQKWTSRTWGLTSGTRKVGMQDMMHCWKQSRTRDTPYPWYDCDANMEPDAVCKIKMVWWQNRRVHVQIERS